MNGSTEQDTGDESESRTTTAWELVPEAGDGSVPVDRRDLRSMRSRIDELEAEVDRLEAELDRARERRQQTVAHYERVLDRSGPPNWTSCRRRERQQGDSRETVRTDGGTTVGESASESATEDRSIEREGAVGRLLSVAAAMLTRG